MAVLYTSFEVGKAGIMFKLEKLQTVCQMYKGRDVSMATWTGFGKLICYKVLPFFIDIALESEHSSVTVASSPVVSGDVTSLQTVFIVGIIFHICSTWTT